MPLGEIDVRDVKDAREALDEVKSSQVKTTIVFFEHDRSNDYPRLVKDTLADMGRNDQVIVVKDRLPIHQIHEVEIAWVRGLSLSAFISM